MMWAVLAGRPKLAHILWEKCRHPMLCALMASQACSVLACDPELSPDKDELQKQARPTRRPAPPRATPRHPAPPPRHPRATPRHPT